MERLISHFLRYGVLSAGVFLALGWLWGLYQDGDQIMKFRTYEPQSLVESLHWAVLLNNRPLIISYFGLVILISLPLIRVLLTGVIFIKQKEYTLASMAFAVLGALLGGFLLGL